MSFIFLIICNVYNYLVQWFSDISMDKKHLEYLIFLPTRYLSLFPGIDSRELKLGPYASLFSSTQLILRWLIYGPLSNEHFNDSITFHFTTWICWFSLFPFNQFVFLFYHIFPWILSWPRFAVLLFFYFSIFWIPQYKMDLLSSVWLGVRGHSVTFRTKEKLKGSTTISDKILSSWGTVCPFQCRVPLT